VPPDEPTAGAELARLYDLDLSEEQPDLDLYRALAAGLTGPVLELAAGTGRISVPLAGAGNRVTAVDNDPDALARAAARWAAEESQPRAGELRLVEADITELALDERFALVVLALNSLLLLPGRNAQLAALRVMAEHLAPDGRAVLDVWLPTPDDLAIYDGRLQVEWVRRDPESGDSVAKTSCATYEPAIGRATVRTFFDSWPAAGGPLRRLGREDELHFITSTELLSLVEAAGLVVETAASDYGLSPFGGDADRIVLVCALL